MPRIVTILAATTPIIGLGLFGYWAYMRHARANRVDSRPRPVLIAGVKEPPEMQVSPIPFDAPTAPERMLNDAIRGKWNSSPAILLPALDRVLARYPNYADGYILRLGSLCNGSDLAAILYNVNMALKYIDNSRSRQTSLAGLYSMRAKIEYLDEKNALAMDDLERAVRADISDAYEFANSGAVKPEKTAAVCTWTERDMGALVKTFPSDYRTYMFKGLYYSFFETWDPNWINEAVVAFDKSATLNEQSPLPLFFMGQAYERAYTLARIDMSRKELKRFNRSIVNGMSKVLAIAPNFVPAIKDRAEAYFELQQYPLAISDYDKIIGLSPKDAGAYNDRALAKMNSGDLFGAIDDFTNAIKNKKRQLQKTSSYEGRADAHVKTQQFDKAIGDLNTAISLQTGGILLLSNIKQFRALYPEYRGVSNEAIAHKLRDTFFPQMKYEDFANSFLAANVVKGYFPSTVIPDLYLKRSDVYLKAGNWDAAAKDFRRALNGFPNYASAIDRWREIGAKGSEDAFIDLKTFDDSQPEAARVWIKQANAQAEQTGPYSLQQYELNCKARQIILMSSASYDSAGHVVGTSEGGKWESVVPDTVGEMVFNGVCPTK